MARKRAITRAVLVYQGGLANVFQVESFGATASERGATMRLYQGDFRSAEWFAIGLATAGVAVTTMGCNMAGDIISQPWTLDLDSLPFSDKFNPIEER